MISLPVPSSAFATKKSKILSQLALPDEEYTDASPKGTVDEAIRDLIDEINALDGFVTTSSCAGRVSVFLEGRKASSGADEEPQPGLKPASSSGGKGGGGEWLFVSHDPIVLDDGGSANVANLFGLDMSERLQGEVESCLAEGARLIHFKFEPMILHIFTASPSHAQVVVSCALQAGFRETGAINFTEGRQDGQGATPMVGIRSMGLSLESLIGFDGRGRRTSIVSHDYLLLLVRIANERFGENRERIERFRSALRGALAKPQNAQDGISESEHDRRERKRAEGLKRQEALRYERRAKIDPVEILPGPDF